MTAHDRLEQLRAEAAHRRERLELYRAKVYGPRATTATRLEELKREYELAASRLNRATFERARRAATERPRQPRDGEHS